MQLPPQSQDLFQDLRATMHCTPTEVAGRVRAGRRARRALSLCARATRKVKDAIINIHMQKARSLSCIYIYIGNENVAYREPEPLLSPDIHRARLDSDKGTKKKLLGSPHVHHKMLERSKPYLHVQQSLHIGQKPIGCSPQTFSAES